jgi:hypothetical protein
MGLGDRGLRRRRGLRGDLGPRNSALTPMIGIITERDILRRVVAAERNPSI